MEKIAGAVKRIEPRAGAFSTLYLPSLKVNEVPPITSWKRNAERLTFLAISLAIRVGDELVCDDLVAGNCFALNQCVVE